MGDREWGRSGPIPDVADVMEGRSGAGAPRGNLRPFNQGLAVTYPGARVLH
jgi:hypothetical protein